MASYRTRTNITATAGSLALGAVVSLLPADLPGWVSVPMIFALVGVGIVFNCLVMRLLEHRDIFRAHLVTGLLIYCGAGASSTLPLGEPGTIFVFASLIGIVMSIGLYAPGDPDEGRLNGQA